MKNPFKSDPDDSFVAAQSALDHANEKIRSLELERESRLFALEDGYVGEIGRIDRELNIHCEYCHSQGPFECSSSSFS